MLKIYYSTTFAENGLAIVEDTDKKLVRAYQRKTSDISISFTENATEGYNIILAIGEDNYFADFGNLEIQGVSMSGQSLNDAVSELGKVFNSAGGSSPIPAIIGGDYEPAILQENQCELIPSDKTLNFIRVDNICTVFGALPFKVTALSDFDFFISLPVPSIISNSNTGGGAGNAEEPGTATQLPVIEISVDDFSGTAAMRMRGVSNQTGKSVLFFQFSYTIG